MGTKSNGSHFTGPLFITGTWRSGSSLLWALLNKHSRVGLMYEADLYLMRQAFWIPGQSHWAQRWEAWNRAPTRHGLDAAQLQQEHRKFADTFAAVHKAYAHAKGADIWGDKSPDIYDRLVPLAKDFPDARFILVWRHPGATLSSMQAAAGKGARFFQKRGMFLRGLISNWKLRRQRDRLLRMGRPVCEIDYEDLVSNTEKVLLALCDFLDLPFEPGITSLEGADSESTHSGEHHSLLRGGTIISKPRARVLNPEAEQKIGRYLCVLDPDNQRNWSGGQAQNAQPEKPGWRERLSDYFLYSAYRSLDESKRLGFCLAPIKVVKRYRQRKPHG
ncbi:MAG TPA: sulfotransferase [Verrucomicrobiae bacterium]|nr:sulfotransferase [Verrucomicrobiae bacterium]